MTKLQDLADVIRSSNAGASMRTFDVMFDDPTHFERVRKSGVLDQKTIGSLYGLEPEVIDVYAYEPALTIKITMPRSVMAGNPDDTDIDGKQQHAPLLTIEVPD